MNDVIGNVGKKDEVIHAVDHLREKILLLLDILGPLERRISIDRP